MSEEDDIQYNSRGRVTVEDIQYLQQVLNYPYSKNSDDTCEDYVDERLLEYQQNFKPIYKPKHLDEEDDVDNKSSVINIDDTEDEEIKKEMIKKKNKKRKRDRTKCIDCDKPATTNTERCKYHNRQVKERIKRNCIDEHEYYNALSNINEKLSDDTLNKISTSLFCRNHFSRKSYRRGLCSACYKKYQKS